jgi:hypothetical protein
MLAELWSAQKSADGMDQNHGPEYASPICTWAGNRISGFRLGVFSQNLAVASFGAAVIFLWRPAALYGGAKPFWAAAFAAWFFQFLDSAESGI